MSDLLSALTATTILQNNAASNVANTNTKDYKAIRTNLVEGKNGDVTVTTERSTTPGTPTANGHETSNVEIDKEFSDMILAQRGFESILSAIETREEMMDDLMRTLGNLGQ